MSGLWYVEIYDLKAGPALVKSQFSQLLALEQDKLASWKSSVLLAEVAIKVICRKCQFLNTVLLICYLTSQMFQPEWM